MGAFVRQKATGGRLKGILHLAPHEEITVREGGKKRGLKMGLGKKSRGYSGAGRGARKMGATVVTVTP